MFVKPSLLSWGEENEQNMYIFHRFMTMCHWIQEFQLNFKIYFFLLIPVEFLYQLISLFGMILFFWKTEILFFSLIKKRSNSCLNLFLVRVDLKHLVWISLPKVPATSKENSGGFFSISFGLSEPLNNLVCLLRATPPGREWDK